MFFFKTFLYFFVSVVALVQLADAGGGLNETQLRNIETQYGKDARLRLLQWQGLIQRDRDQANISVDDRLANANTFFNRVPWLTDLEHWGVEDYWATPVEMLATNGGDCEDYSIGKYFSLLATNFDASKLRITYVKSLTYNQAHMVLAYYETPTSEPLILDNINGVVLPASQRTDLQPIYSFNSESIWLAKDRGRELKGDSQNSLPKWKALNERMLKSME